MRLIVADALERWLEMNYANANPLDYNTKATLAECLTKVKASPTIDAVPVVRCKECIRRVHCVMRVVFLRCRITDGYCRIGVRREGAKIDGKSPASEEGEP